MTILFTHEDCLNHNPGDEHPERPARLKAILSALDHADFAGLERRAAPLAERADIALVHAADFVDAILAAAPKHGRVMIDSDTLLSPGSDRAALRAAGAVVAAVEAVCAGEAKTAFCAVRPPGHHAEPERAMGFCLFKSISMCITETVPKRSPKDDLAGSMPRRINGRSIPAPGPHSTAVHMGTSSMRLCRRERTARGSGPLSRKI